MKHLFSRENRAYSLALAAATVTDYAVFGLVTYALKKGGCSHEFISLATPLVKSTTFLAANALYHKAFRNLFDKEEDSTSELNKITLSNIAVTLTGMALRGGIQYTLLERGMGSIASLVHYPLIGTACLKLKTVMDTHTGVIKRNTKKNNSNNVDLESRINQE